jgi:mRNA-degrading endonuclease toxin of MazEF toxin-antitoxin module
VVLVSRDTAYAVRASISVVEVSTTIRGIPSEVQLSRRDGLPKKCVANTDNVVTIPKRWLRSRITALTQAKVDALDAALRFSLGLE